MPVIRWSITILLIYLSYKETGFFTALSLFFIFIGFEAMDYLIRETNKKIANGLRYLEIKG